jgi:hypothetical protein
MSLYYELGLDRFLINRQRRQSKIECNTSSIMKMLVVNRILSPGSKRKAFEEKKQYFDFENVNAFSLTDVYRSLSFFARLEADGRGLQVLL